MLRLGLFNFRNDDVLLIAGDRDAVTALGNHLRAEFDSGKACVAVHDIASVSKRHPATLFAVRGDCQPPEKNSAVWPCSEADLQKLIAAGAGASELHFELARTPPYLYVSFSGHYGEAWWTTYG
jgi:hypothetical protein